MLWVVLVEVFLWHCYFVCTKWNIHILTCCMNIYPIHIIIPNPIPICMTCTCTHIRIRLCVMLLMCSGWCWIVSYCHFRVSQSITEHLSARIGTIECVFLYYSPKHLKFYWVANFSSFISFYRLHTGIHTNRYNWKNIAI